MASWVRRIATVSELVCDSCFDLIPIGAQYFKTTDGCAFCADCEPSDDEEAKCQL